MAARFSISGQWWKRSTARQYDDSDFAIWDEESRRLFRFVAEFEGVVTLHFGELEVVLDLDDIPMIFGELDMVTDALRVQGGQAELYFASQGTDLRLSLDRSDDTIGVTFHLGITAARELEYLTGVTTVVYADSFLESWLGLRDRIRAAFLLGDDAYGA